MTGTKRDSSAMEVAEIAAALPPTRRPVRHQTKSVQKPMPPSLPSCFAEVWKRRHSTLPAHQRERAALEAVASTIPPEAANLAGPAAAAVYLAALVAALDRLVKTTKLPKQALKVDSLNEVEHRLSKKERKQLRKQRREAEAAVKDMTAPEALRPSSKGKDDESMKVDVGYGNADDETGNGDEDANLISSLVYLIGLAVGGCSAAVLNAKSDPLLDITMEAYDRVSGHSAAARHTSTVFASTLAVLDLSAWSKPVTQRAYLYLLRQTTDADAKSRRKAREALDALLHCPRASIVRSRTSTAAASHYAGELKMLASMLSVDSDTVIGDPSVSVTLIHHLTSIERFSIALMPHDAARVAKEIAMLAIKDNPEVASFAFLALWSMFKQKREEQVEESPLIESFLPSKDIGRLLQAVLRHDIPEDISNEWRIAYACCVSDGALAYANSFPHSPPPNDFVLKPIERLCDTLNLTGISDGSEAIARVSRCLESLISHRWFQTRPMILGKLLGFMDTRHRSVWTKVTPLVKRYLEQEMTAGNHKMDGAVRSLVNLLMSQRLQAIKDGDRKKQGMIHTVLAAVVHGGGAAQVLSVCEVKYDAKDHLTNAWLLPVFVNHARGAPLSLFESHFVPLAEKLQEVAESLQQQKRMIEAKNVSMYRTQVWSLLPGFCTSPSDISQDGILTVAFKAIHFCLTDARDEIPMTNNGAGALRQLSFSLLNMSSADPLMSARRASFATRFKKIFPKILGLSEKLPDERRSSILNAVTVACQAVSDSSLVSNLLRRAIRRLLELQLNASGGPQGDIGMSNEERTQVIRSQHAMADLAIAIAESNAISHNAAEIEFLDKAMSPFFMDARESALQKKAYRAISLLVPLKGMEGDGNEFLQFLKGISEAAATVAPGAKAAREGLLVTLVNQQLKLRSNEKKVEFLQNINDLFLSEIVLGTRDSSEKTRSASFLTLVALARSWNTCVSGSDISGLQRFMMSVAAGLGGKSVTMLSATLTSLGRLIYDFRGEAAVDARFAHFIDTLFANIASDGDDNEMSSEKDEARNTNSPVAARPGPVAILLRHSAAEVQKSALGVVKVATKALSDPPARLVQVLPGILPGLVHVSARSKKQETRMRVRVILERLLRKCGRDVLESNFPQEHIKLLAAVRKKHSRDLIKKHAAKERRSEARTRSLQADRIKEEEDMVDDRGDMYGLDDSDSDIEREILDGDDLLTKKPVDTDSQNMKDASQQARHDRSWIRVGRQEDVIKYTDDGKPILVESDDNSGEVEFGSVTGDDSSDEEDERQSRIATRETLIGKRSRTESKSDVRSLKKMKGSYGEEYRSKRGAGDVKRAGRPDPYAYVPLGMNMFGPGARPGTIGTKRNRTGSSLHRLAVGRAVARRKGKTLGAPGRR